MLYIRLCIDKSGSTELRNRLRPEHRAYFQPNLQPGAAVRLVQAGPLCIGDSDDNLGSFMILEAPSLADAQRFHDDDPFTKAGLFATAHVHRWDKHVG